MGRLAVLRRRQQVLRHVAARVAVAKAVAVAEAAEAVVRNSTHRQQVRKT